MLNRSFTTREKILLIILCVFLLGIIYYEFVVKDLDKTIKEYNTADLEDELSIEQTKAQSIAEMKNEMLNSKETGSRVPTYNNINNELNVLNDVFSSAKEYDLNFNQAVAEGNTVRRTVDINFTVGSYSSAESIIMEIYNCKYRCLINDIQISSGDSEKGDVSSGGIDVNMSVTFYETLYNATTKAGLGTDNDNKENGK